jgi:hypothetical protein
MRTRTAAAVFSMLMLLAGCSASSAQPAPSMSSAEPTGAGPVRGREPSVVTPLVADTVAAPVPVPATDGKVHLAYELRLTNVLSHDVTLTEATVLDRDVAVLNLKGERLSARTRILGNPSPTTRVGPAQTAVIWFDVVLDQGMAVPTALTHAISVSDPQPQPPLFPASMTETVAPVTVQTRRPIVIASPLSGPNWVDGDGCCGMSAHRMALNPINGGLWAAERFAIDYVQLGPDGRLVTGDPEKLESFAYFGSDIHAVTDGPVVAALDGLPEQVPGKNPTGLPLDQYAGNHVVQDLGDGNYALYAHIKTGTVKVKPGDRLTAGQVIGNVGNTGNSTAPHLHFHVMSTPDPLRSDGLPFVFTDFRLDARIADMDDLDVIFDGRPAPLQPDFAGRDETDVMPLELDVMTYADR